MSSPRSNPSSRDVRSTSNDDWPRRTRPWLIDGVAPLTYVESMAPHWTYDPEVPSLILLNGPPASGKSTIAQRHVDGHPPSLNLEIDVLRRLVGGWADDPERAGLVARSFALTMAAHHLGAGHDVIVPQFLGRVAFIDQLDAVAGGAGAGFIEVALWLDPSEARAAFAERSAAPTTAARVDAAVLVERSPRADPLGSMYDEFVAVIEGRPHTLVVDVARGDVDATYQRFIDVIERSSST